MKYTLNAYGWSIEAVANELTDEQVQIIKDKMKEEGHEELYQIRFDLDALLDLDFWDGEVFHRTEAFDNDWNCFAATKLPIQLKIRTDVVPTIDEPLKNKRSLAGFGKAVIPLFDLSDDSIPVEHGVQDAQQTSSRTVSAETIIKRFVYNPSIVVIVQEEPATIGSLPAG